MQRNTFIVIQLLLTGLLLFITPFSAWGGEKTNPSRIPAHTPEWTNPNQSDPGMTEARPSTMGLRAAPSSDQEIDSVASDLQGIVVLCAEKPQSAEFDRAWALYLEKHYKPGMNVNRLVEDILTRAENHLRFGDGRRGARKTTSFDRNKTRQRMRGTADRVIANLR